ncbi:hypothetical protein [Parazoarcus communis]|uniref:hypothetical protein n=1 Tax=Parazoarcus communis TaxID=41977 RepID=UPI00131F420F|nr:hypothetical protein [Parazoarcus communis]
MSGGFSLVDRLARWQLDCPTLVDPVLGARTGPVPETVRPPTSDAPGDELAPVAILSEN